MTRRARETAWYVRAQLEPLELGQSQESTTTSARKSPLLSASVHAAATGASLATIGQEPPMVLATASYWKEGTWLKRSQIPAPAQGMGD